MKPNLWQKMYGAKRRASDRRLLALLEKEIADEEKLRAKQAARDARESPEDQRRRIAAAFGRVV